eukprot:TRINITY_DN84326_c0_g1_i1.p1 TRINITY_DN84326_c0_g1~~TRINITY_DN84326_c0_g1_i1.p1  ORF type:complete len:310 (-),score=35.62 TRINITY_DN84326_c0_g1_i1:187-1116(-)
MSEFDGMDALEVEADPNFFDEDLIPTEANLLKAELDEQANLRKVLTVPKVGRGTRDYMRSSSSPSFVLNPKGTQLLKESHNLNRNPSYCPPQLIKSSIYRDFHEVEQSKGRGFIFHKPPFLYQTPPTMPHCRLKASLLQEDDIDIPEELVSADPPIRNLCSSAGEDQRLAEFVDCDYHAPATRLRPLMPTKLFRRDMTGKSRSRHSEEKLQTLRTLGIRRTKYEKPHECMLGPQQLTYYSFEEETEWQMHRRPEYKSPKQLRSLDGEHGKMSPGTTRHPTNPPKVDYVVWYPPANFSHDGSRVSTFESR